MPIPAGPDPGVAWSAAYVTAAELKAFVRIDDTADDTQVGFAIEAASRAVDQHTGRQFGKVAAPEARRYTGRWDYARWVVDIDDLMDATGLVVSVPAGVVDVTDLEPVNAAQTGQPWTRLAVGAGSAHSPTGAPHEVTVTALWGWTAVPPAVKNATLLQASRFFARRESPYGIAGSPDQGSELRLLSKLDPDVAVMLGPYTKRQWVFA